MAIVKKLSKELRLKLKKKASAPLSLRDRIMKQLKCTVFVKPGKAWLDIHPDFNAVWGSRKLGLPAGKMYQFAGKKHGGKSALVAYLAGVAQRQHKAFVIWIDAENSFDYNWMKRLGLSTGKKETEYNSDDFYLIYPKVLKRSVIRKKGKKKIAANVKFLQSCEFLFEEAEQVMGEVKELDPDRPLVVVVDSIAFLQTEMQVEAGQTNNNMRTDLDRAQFLKGALPKWVNLGKNYTMWIFNINQIRVNPTKIFGNPEYSPGGSALEHACHVMGGIRRKSGVEEKDGKAISISGYMINGKNKAGGGSLEGEMCDYKVNFNKLFNKGMWQFGPHKKKKKTEGGNDTAE